MKVGICAIIKDCYEPYLIEWLQYHHDIGVDYFFIFDNDSAIPVSEITNKVPFCGDIYHGAIHGLGVQGIAYGLCLRRVQLDWPLPDWLAFIDEDEFIRCENGDIRSCLKGYENYSGVGLNWRIFGSSGLEQRTPERQRDKFVMYTGAEWPPNRHIKSIVNPLKVSHCLTPHHFAYQEGFCVDVEKKRVPGNGPFVDPPIYKTMWIDHYFTRSLEEWMEKIKRPRADSGKTDQRPFLLLRDIDLYSARSIDAR